MISAGGLSRIDITSPMKPFPYRARTSAASHPNASPPVVQTPTGHVEADGERYTYRPGVRSRPLAASQVTDALCRCAMLRFVVGCLGVPAGGPGGGALRRPSGCLSVAPSSPRGNVSPSRSGAAANVTQARDRNSAEAPGLCDSPLSWVTSAGGRDVGPASGSSGRLAFRGRPSR
uniref:Uncharacterized protein n=1 Tax=Human herpesvirus 2 TaxID=10310 RepID=A0A481TX77_HHV2|nr:hypothetical protein [Human alphaherpesvirus 2]QBH85293.1 hypothetical protein [Human alphaherpesvirus 2]